MFTGYMIVSPSLWWDNESLLQLAPRLLKTHSKGLQKVYISVGAEGLQMEGDAKRLVDLLKEYENQYFKIFFAPLPAEDHLTILHNSIYKGLEVLNTRK